MQNKDVYCIGVMSGTSLDGLDLVHVKFNEFNGDWRFEILNAETLDYPKRWKYLLGNLANKTIAELQEFDKDYTTYLADKINVFMEVNKITEVDFIASHGHTALHQPDNGLTYQIGNRSELANYVKQIVVCDFRVQDVKLGGQGAPLVPIGDELLFSNYDFCLNLGGFANISYKQNTQRIAFDICPVNIVLNYYCRKLNLEYDDKGQIASNGKINQELLDKLNQLDFYQKTPPKSLGLEWVQECVFPLIDNIDTNIPNVLKTFVEHSAMQIGKIIRGNSSVLVTGGGVFNTFLMERIQHYAEAKIQLPNKKIINYKEALVFAFLGLLRIQNKNNCLKSVTGARKDHSSGVIFYPNK